MNKTSRMIAKAFKQMKPAQGDEAFVKGVRRGIELSVLALSDALAREYPAFDKAAFLRSCAVTRQGINIVSVPNETHEKSEWCDCNECIEWRASAPLARK